ncbi:MAG: hypothetical protein LBJ15_19505 [Comamonas sp.]|uniref:HipA family kinase n=1 Tax=Comamonas sp. TaxID=34028 RepID=UPI00282D0063|nr:HipA family kinase [Comamonas sp.]MDR0216162.1 hypothetical protein [Comamonas sp.]
MEIIRKADSGTQEPFICRASDNQTYYVKGGGKTNRSSLVNEFLCAELAQAIGLPQPKFDLLHVSEDLLSETSPPLAAIGHGVAFGSLERRGCTLLGPPQISSVPLALQQKLFAFDWWILNGDRTDWNSNLLWDQGASSMAVIDHNLAFDTELDLPTFLDFHICREAWRSIDLASSAELQELFCQAMRATLAKACNNLPPEWFFLPPECLEPANVDLAKVQATLSRCESEEFWRLP